MSAAALADALPGIRIRLRRSRRTLLSLRHGPHGPHLGIDPRLLEQPGAPELIVEWVSRRGRGGAGAGLRDLLTRVQREGLGERLRSVPPAIAGLPVLGGTPDLEAVCAAVHGRWFADLPPVAIGWARMAHRSLRAIRFGCYRRGDPARISIHPRLARPWVARVFLEHVVFHELCHHRQAHQPLWRRERMHSPRFRSWERAYPAHAEALAWEKAALPCLLDDTPPPWSVPAP